MVKPPFIRVDTARGQQLWVLLALCLLALSYWAGRHFDFDLFPRMGAVLVGLSIVLSLYSIPLHREEFSRETQDRFGVQVGDVSNVSNGERSVQDAGFQRRMNDLWIAKMNHDDQVGLVKVSAMLAVIGTLVWAFGDLVDGVS